MDQGLAGETPGESPPPPPPVGLLFSAVVPLQQKLSYTLIEPFSIHAMQITSKYIFLRLYSYNGVVSAIEIEHILKESL